MKYQRESNANDNMKLSIQSVIWSVVFVGVAATAVVALIPKPIEVETAVVMQGNLRLTIQEDGKSRIREKYIVSAPVAGRLSRIELNAGDEVLEGNRLIAVILPAEPAMLDARSKAQAEARVEQAQAAIKRTDAAVEQVRVNQELTQTKFERAERMHASQSISQDEYDVARAANLTNTQALRTAKFDQEIAKYELDMAKAALLQFDGEEANATIPFQIFAPVYGKVLRVFQESATVLNVGTPLVELGDPMNLELEIDVLSTDAVRIKPGAELTIEHWGGGSPLRGTVRVIEPAAFTKVSSLGVEEQRVNIICDFDESPGRLAKLGDGYRVEARITITELEDVIQVANSALFRNQRIWHVFVVKDGKAELRKVRIGLQNETHTQILDGLAAEEEVIKYPSDQVTHNASVRKIE